MVTSECTSYYVYLLCRLPLIIYLYILLCTEECCKTHILLLILIHTYSYTHQICCLVCLWRSRSSNAGCMSKVIPLTWNNYHFILGVLW